MAVVSMSLSAAIVLLLGVIHLAYTFSGSKLAPRDPAVRDSMSQAHPVITRQTTMWRAWVGFNASHAMGAILFGLVYGYLAMVHSRLLFRSPFLLLVGAAMLGGLLALGKLYWFRTPFLGLAVSLALYLLGVAAFWV